MSKPHSLAFFLPAHNEQENLPSVIKKIKLYAKSSGINTSIIVVDDGSTDNTAKVLSTIPDIRVVSHDVNQGYGAALRSGLKAALSCDCEWIAFCDADGQFDPSDISRLFMAASTTHADAVLGYRQVRADSIRRRLMGRGWHYLSRLLLGYHAKDVDCGFKLFTYNAIKTIMPTLSGNYAMISPELIAKLQRHGFVTAETPVPHYPRKYGVQTGASPSVVLASLVDIFRMSSMIRKVV